MDHFQRIYQQEAEAYHRLISAEDVDGNLLPALQAITALPGKRVLDVGTGSGRIPLLLHDQVKTVTGLDRFGSMLREHRRQQQLIGQSWPLVQGDMGWLPFGTNQFDLTIAGWAVGHLTSWAGDQWPIAAGRVVRELERVTRPGGVIVVIETLGTATLAPSAPDPGLETYYLWLERQQGFSRREIATDYQFRDLEEAGNLIDFFFGREMGQKVRELHWVRVPEWTGIWWKQAGR